MDITEIIVEVLTAVEIGFIATVAIRIFKMMFLKPPVPEVEQEMLYVRAEEVLQDKSSIYLISDADTNRFLCQGNSTDEVRDQLIKISDGRAVILVAGNGEKYRLKL